VVAARVSGERVSILTEALSYIIPSHSGTSIHHSAPISLYYSRFRSDFVPISLYSISMGCGACTYVLRVPLPRRLRPVFGFSFFRFPFPISKLKFPRSC